MNNRANINADVFGTMSKTQKNKLDAELMANIDSFAKSEIFRAMSADVLHSSKAAFRSTESDKATDITRDDDAEQS